MRIGILTFHAAHNYGSMLQNYALQQVLIKLGYEPETINLRTSIQKEMYDFFMPVLKMTDKKHVIRKLIFYPWKNSLEVKRSLFEEFLNQKIKLSKEIGAYEELNSIPKYDSYIIGSDQCWNVSARDFDWSYFLDFVPSESKRLSYAISMGPNPKMAIESKLSFVPKIKQELKKFSGISVRDNDTRDVIEDMTDNLKKVNVNVDPTLLLSKEEWEKIIPSEPLVKHPYIFFYNPYWIPEAFEQAYKLGKILNMPVVTSLPNLMGTIKYPGFEKFYKVGPVEFLNLVKNADYVIGRSFHLIVFCIIFKKKFIAIEGMGDSRLKQLLENTELQICASKNGNIEEILEKLNFVSFDNSELWIQKEKQSSIDWLNCNLNL